MKVTEPLLLSGTVRLASKNGLWFVNKFKFDYSNESETMDNRKTSLSIIHSETWSQFTICTSPTMNLVCPAPLLPTIILFNYIVFQRFSVGIWKRNRTLVWTRIDPWIFRWHTFEHWCGQGFALSVLNSGNEYRTTIVYIPVSAFQTAALPR